ncbi:hypothetical protein C8A01DRAFT_46610 [Parachaetomium inaequale]|uniref:Uncharacterized protein n=1 Tax=Parachaetomium inaequale TaxID=2588326 RepID=A0AAN6PFM1_9PEZI|nr:hypothetical protein C8A01DRAFT_46610 [Parachaetomium inaequale]
MRDDSLAHSKLYFQLLQLLRIIPLWIRETRYDLEKLRNDCSGSIFNPIPSLNHQPFLATAGIVRQNWDEVLGRFQVLETELQRRIDAKTDEIRGLRDGLFSASGLQEAHKATSMNRYIIIFTTVTIFYLPPAFVTAVFSMDLLHDEKLAFLKSTYAATIVTASVVTYIVAFGLVLFVDRRKVVPYLIGRPQSLVPAFLLSGKGTAPSGMPTEITEKAWLENGQSGPWSGFLAAPAPTPRQRRKTGRFWSRQPWEMVYGLAANIAENNSEAR